MRNSHGFVLRVGTLVVLCMTGDPVHAQVARDPAYEARARSYLASLVYTRDAVDRWLQGHAAHGESYHEVLGWGPRSVCKVRGIQNRSGVKIRIVWAMWPRCAATRKSRLWAS